MEWDSKTGYENGMIWLPKSKARLRQIKAALTFIYGNADYKKEKRFHLYRETEEHIGIPRHFLDRTSLMAMGVQPVDLRPSWKEYEEIDIYSKIQLDALWPGETIQQEAVAAWLKMDDGIISLACGKGKTLVGLHIWAQLRVPVIIMADNTSILEGWADQIRMFISPKDVRIGKVYDGDKGWDCPVVLASVQSLMRMAEKGFPPKLGRRFGLFIADETHKIAAPKFSLTAPLFMGRRLGLTATAERTDRLHPVYEYHFGKVVYQNLEQALTPDFEVYTPTTSRNLMDNPSFRRRSMSYGDTNTQKIWSALAEEDARTREIANLIKRKGEGRRVLVISQRKEMLHRLHDLLPDSGVIVSETDLKKRTDVLQKAHYVLGIMGIAKEGLNSPTLSMLVVCEPYRDQNLFQQTVGRILRDVPGKPHPIVIIIADSLGEGSGPVYGLVMAMKKTIMTWPPEKGGPYSWSECVG